MDLEALRAKLSSSTKLVLGDVKNTVPAFVQNGHYPPIGFVSIDVDLFSSTQQALRILSLPERKTLKRVILYLDDVGTLLYHRFAGELRAVDEFNETNQHVKIDCWRGIRSHRPFPENPWLNKMYVAYDLEAMSRIGFEGRKRQILDLTNLQNLSQNQTVDLPSDFRIQRS